LAPVDGCRSHVRGLLSSQQARQRSRHAGGSRPAFP
jgi:hypothetical protein